MADPLSIGPTNPIRGRPEFNHKTKAEAPSPAKVEVAHSRSLPKLVKLASDLAKQGAPVDFVKIAQIRQAIANDSYTIDPRRIAESMVMFGNKSEPDI